MKKTKHPKDSKKTVKNGTTTIIHRRQQISNLIPKKKKKKIIKKKKKKTRNVPSFSTFKQKFKRECWLASVSNLLVIYLFRLLYY